MDELVEQIESLRFRTTNNEGRCFVTKAELCSVVSELMIRVSLTELDLPLYQHKELVSNILQGARRCFAILLMIRSGSTIVHFFKKDSLQRSHPDDRLPFNPDLLAGIFGVKPDDLKVKRFLERQWEFATPVFSRLLLTRELAQGVILPFAHEDPIGEGSFGTVYRSTIHPQCHELPNLKIDRHRLLVRSRS
jgi:hypothetical protein